ncbi:TRAP transporter small permease [bacterium]|nr:TRAP transporter small permease [bacterium]
MRRLIINKISAKLINHYTNFLDKVAYLCNIITGLALVIMTVIFSWLVYGRYVLNSTPTWVEQVSLLLVVLIGFLGAAIGIHKKTHLGVSYFRDRMPRFLQITFDLITHLMLIIFGYVMMVYSYKLAVFKWTTQIPLIHIPEGLRAVPIMVCGALILLFSIGHILNYKNKITDNNNSE